MQQAFTYRNPPLKNQNRAIIIIISLLLAFLCIPACLAETTNDPVSLHILSVNDFHGQIVPGKQMNGSPAGSIPVLGAYLRDAISRYGEDNTIITLQGDMTGASPAESNLLLDEPTVLFFNSFVTGDWKETVAHNGSGVTVIATLGNHEFDRSETELLRIIHGGNGDTSITHIVDPYPGALWPTISANVYKNGTSDLLFPPYSIQTVDGIPVAFIGAVTQQTGEISTPASVKNVTFTDEADAINSQVKILQDQGIHSFIVLLHEGGAQTPYDGPTQETGDLSGRVASITMRLDEDVDVVLSGHTHEFTNQYLPNAGGKATLVTQAWSYSQAYADVNLTLDPVSQDIIEKTATILPAYADQGVGLYPDENAQELLDVVNQTVGPFINEVIATTTVPLTRTLDENGESNLYDIAVDSIRWSTDADMAVLNIGSLRTDIPAGEVTTGDAYSVMPFHNQICIVLLTGQQVKDLLNQQWTRTIKPDHFLQISGFSYSYDLSRDPSDRVLNITKDGEELDMAMDYTVATIDFLATGGDGYTALKEGEIIQYGNIDVDEFIAYMKFIPSPVHIQTGERITILGNTTYSDLI